MVFDNLEGKKFGKLTVIRRVEEYISPKGYHATRWFCKCDCGNYVTVRSCNIKNGGSKSCGCERKINPNRKTHGQKNTPLYNIWIEMRVRCRNKKYERYAGRGISVCEEWDKDFMNFYNWAMANGYKKGLSIDRIDNDGNYCPENCRWVTNKVQQNNKSNNHLLSFNGETLTMSQWADKTGISWQKIKDRITKLNWSVEKALTTK